MKIEDKLNLSEDRGQISKIEDSPLKNQADGQPNHKRNVDVKYMKSQFGTSDINVDAWAWKLTRIHSKWDLYLNTNKFSWKSNLYCDADNVMRSEVTRIISMEMEKHSKD